MRICFITPYFFPYFGGIQKCVLRLAEELALLRCEVEVITSDYVLKGHDRSSLPNVPFRIKRLTCAGVLFEVPIVPGLAKEVCRTEADILHITGMYPLFTDMALLAGRIISRPTVLHYHFDPVPTSVFGRPLEKAYQSAAGSFAEMADAVVASGRSYVKTSPILSKLLGKVAVIPNGVDLTFFEEPSEVELHRLRRRLKIAQDEKVVLFVGQLKYFKGIHVLIESLLNLRKDVKCKLVVVGKGPEEGKLQALACRLGLSDRVVFAGFVQDNQLPLYYNLSDVYALPSLIRRENFGITILEAMASGKPVVASNLPGPSEIIDHEVTGILTKPGDAFSLAHAILRLLNDRELIASMGVKGRLKARNYTWPVIARRFDSLYNTILDS